MWPWLLATAVVSALDVCSTALFTVDLRAPLSRYRANAGSGLETFFGNQLYAALFLPIVFARGVVLWVGNLVCLVVVGRVVSQVRHRKRLTADVVRPGKGTSNGHNSKKTVGEKAMEMVSFVVPIMRAICTNMNTKMTRFLPMSR